MPASLDAILTDALKAEEWLEKNRLSLKCKVCRPFALARVFAGNDRVGEILEQVCKKQPENWTELDEDQFHSICTFWFTDLEDMELFMVEIKDNQDLLTDIELI